MGFFVAKYARSATLVVAASDSRDRANADYICDGTDDQVEINAAINALPSGGGMVTLLEGTYNITASINIVSNVTLVGQGAGTVLRVPDGYNADINVIWVSSADRVLPFWVPADEIYHDVLIQDLRIDGNRANQTAGDMRGVYFHTVTYSKISRCWVENMRGAGIYIHHSSYIDIIANTVQGNSRYGIDIYYSPYNTVIGNIVQNNYDGIINSAALHNTISGNIIQGNSRNGIYLWPGDYVTVTGNTIQGNANNGIRLGASWWNTITGNTIQGNANNGIRLWASSINTITGNSIQYNSQHGIYLTGSSNNNTIVGNTVRSNSQEIHNTYDGIIVDSDSNYNNIQSNTIRRDTVANQHRYGIRINSADCDGNLTTNNDLYLAGVTANLSDAGAGTIIDGNRGNVGRYQTAAYGAAWATWVVNIVGTPANGTRCVFWNTDTATGRLGCYANGVWRYVDLT